MPRTAPRLAPLLLLAATLVVPAGQAMAQGPGGLLDRSGAGRDAGDRFERAQRDESRRDERHDRGEDHRALSDAVRRVERRTGGRILSAERVPFDGRNVNRVKVVDSQGRVRVYMDDPQGQGPQREQRPRDRDDD
ncbi:PepSY domain-containing protein [Lysobacter yangpyeongensis]|uniref:PepSY domain-containing protein n=1 Tax=Lysobacter yangpyeongensis TaxID=346182 RepID=A0ABW0SS03_9GAMM